MMTKTIIAFAIIAIISLDIVSCGVIRDQDNFLLGNERISKRSINENDALIPSSVDVEETASESAPVEQQHVISRRSIRSDEYRQQDDLIMSIVPKAIFGERILRRFVEENVFIAGSQNNVFKPQFRFRDTIVEKIALP
ncbi:hypothetical protein Trydic_g22217 [Trypoxylus dichotomus]